MVTSMLMSTRPASRSVVMSAAPLYGTCVIWMPQFFCRISPARCTCEPTPDEANVTLPGFALA